MTPLPDALLELANRLRRLTPCWQNPERFHEAKSELVNDLRRLARDVPAPQVRRVLVPVEKVVERVVERVVYIPAPKPQPRRAKPCTPSTPDLFAKVNK